MNCSLLNVETGSAPPLATLKQNSPARVASPLFRRADKAGGRVRSIFGMRLGLLPLALALVLAIVQSGCQGVMLLGYLIGGPPMTDPDFHHRTNKESLAGKNKSTVVYCYAAKELKWDNEAVDYEIAKHVAYRLMSKDIKVVDPDRVQAWLDKNDKWRKTAEIGKAFKADYVVHIDVKDFSLFEANAQNLYRGRADIIINVVKMDDDKKDGNVIYTNPLKSFFPLRAAVDSNQMSFAEFKKHYLSALSDEIGKLFYSVATGDDIPYGMML